ncbi:MAG: hypothetical protein ACLS8R_00605 [Anaeromassilibacillus sp.]
MTMQGAVDCAFEEDGSLVIVDFKTDHTKDEAALWERYRAQLALTAGRSRSAPACRSGMPAVLVLSEPRNPWGRDGLMCVHLLKNCP